MIQILHLLTNKKDKHKYCTSRDVSLHAWLGPEFFLVLALEDGRPPLKQLGVITGVSRSLSFVVSFVVGSLYLLTSCPSTANVP